MLGILLSRGLCGFAGKTSEPEGNRETGLAVALSRYLGLVGDLKEESVHHNFLETVSGGGGGGGGGGVCFEEPH